MRRLGRLTFRFLHRQRGISLIEALVAASILAAIGAVFMTAMYTGYRGVGILDEQQQAEALVRSQIEDIKGSSYQDTGVYPVTVELQSQYSMDISVEALNTPTCEEDNNCNTLQKITVSIHHGNKPVLAVSCYKAKL